MDPTLSGSVRAIFRNQSEGSSVVSTDGMPPTSETSPSAGHSRSVADISRRMGDFDLDSMPVDKEGDKKRKLKRFKSIGKEFKRLFSGKTRGESKKNQVQEIHIVQEDETDYDQQWSRKVSRAASFGQPHLLDVKDKNANTNGSRGSSSAGFKMKMSGISFMMVGSEMYD